MHRNIIGLDIGGANLKAAHVKGAARTEPFEVWKQPQKLGKAIELLLARLPTADSLAVTMTAELCDCYATKREGVNAILNAVEGLGRQKISVWQNDGQFASVAQARRQPQRTASANWLALATFAGRYCPSDGPALLVDVGSTTTDVIPIRDGVPAPEGRTDLERLAHGELLYMGVRRTPVCALFDPNNGLIWREGRVPPAAELFATTQDAYLLLGDLSEDRDDLATADGRPAIKRMAHARLARMICSDTETCGWDDVMAIAQQIREHQMNAILESAGVFRRRSQKRDPQVVVLAGTGEFLARAAIKSRADWKPRLVSLADELGPKLSEAACAYAVAVLAKERLEA
jgi:probable H4MPT-linked C1 transfer pathway protein